MIRLLDIEGTTTSISFVLDQLFPYARRALCDYLGSQAEQGRLEEIAQGFREQWQEDAAAGMDSLPIVAAGASHAELLESLVAHIGALMDQDRKVTPLKALQGEIWDAGYASGEIRGQVYADTPRALQRWHERGEPTYIYSSGSIHAQKLLFGHSEAGDLTPFLAGYFDTTSGPKKEAESYRQIAADIGVAPAEICFFSDNLDEIRAAAAAGMEVRVALRPGNAPLAAHEFPVIRDFDGI